MKLIDVLVIGGGPAGLCAAANAKKSGLDTLLIERDGWLGGQLVKQTHMFFGSKEHHAKTRGMKIAKILIAEIESVGVEVFLNTTVVGIYDDLTVNWYNGQTYGKVKAKAIIIAAGAREKMPLFENNDLPGVYGAGAVQTLMNMQGIRPGKRAVMLGSGNIGLIVSYQLWQAGVRVDALLEASDSIGGYKVHASKLRRLGTQIKTQTTIQRVIGKEAVEAVETIELDAQFNPIPGTEEIIVCDLVCIAVGLSPMNNLLSMSGAKLRYVPSLGGEVPVLNGDGQTSIENLYACGDVSGIEEASSAMVEGRLCGLIVARKLKKNVSSEHIDDLKKQLDTLRSGPFGEKIEAGIRMRDGV